MLLDERQSVLDRGLMGPFDHNRHRRISDCPQGGHRLHRRERQVITSHRLGSRPRVFRDLPSDLPGIHRFPAMLGTEELPGHLSPHLRPVSRRDRGVGRPSDCRVERRDAVGHLDPKRAQIVVDHLERRPQPGHILKILSGEVGSFKLLLPQLGQRVQAAAEQGSHLPAVTGSPAASPSIPSMPDPIHTPGDSPRSV
jgi:hypothetical protein